jgi:hypothetical protein
VDCHYLPWSDSSSCVNGVKSQERSAVYPMNGGQACDPSLLTQLVACPPSPPPLTQSSPYAKKHILMRKFRTRHI